jgi:hypothetical protein
LKQPGGKLVNMRVGKAIDTLPELLQEGLAPFDSILLIRLFVIHVQYREYSSGAIIEG